MLKNIYLIFNFLKKEKIINKIIILSFFIKILIVLFLKKKNIFKIILYFKDFIIKTINKKNRNFCILFSNLIFLNILFYNLIDLIPNNLIKDFFKLEDFNIVPTSNINITFCFSLISLILTITFSIKKIGFINFLMCFIKHPIKNKYMIIFNFLIESISFIMKPLSLSLRLFGNIFASDIIFNLISKLSIFLNIILNLIWGIFHYLILPLQSFIFITLVIIYISQSLNY